MALLFNSPRGDGEAWRAEFKRLVPDLEFRLWPDEAGNPVDIEYVLIQQPEPGQLGRYPNLKAIFSFGAGVDHYLTRPDRPPQVPIVRCVSEALNEGVTHYVVHWVLSLHRRFHRYHAHQAAGHWEKLPYGLARDRKVGILGMGELGAASARSLAALGFDVAGWSRRAKSVGGVASFHGDGGLMPFLARSEILAIFLPVTSATQGFLNTRTLNALPKGACLVNIARGPIINDDDLLAALESGQVATAVLDNFHVEPLPAKHPYWTHPRVIVTPHAAGGVVPGSAAAVMADSIRAIRAGKRPRFLVDSTVGY